MASATTRPIFSFFHPHLHHQPPIPPPKSLSLPLTPKPPTTKSHHFTAIRSVDVSQDDKPLSETNTTNQEPPPTTPNEEQDYDKKDAPKNFDPRRLEEKFAVLNTGVYECGSCGYRYEESAGDPSYPIPPGLQFGKLPEDWRCPTCGAAKSFFQSKSIEIAGFAQNQQFGLGANTLTSGQKALLIYGSLLFFFVLFLSGYFLQ